MFKCVLQQHLVVWLKNESRKIVVDIIIVTRSCTVNNARSNYAHMQFCMQCDLVFTAHFGKMKKVISYSIHTDNLHTVHIYIYCTYYIYIYIYILGVARYMYSYRTVTVQASRFDAWGLTTNTGNSPPIQKGARWCLAHCILFWYSTNWLSS